MQLYALLRLAFTSAPLLQQLNLATYNNSPVRSTKSTRSHISRASSVCKHRVSGSLSLPSRGTFHLSLTVLYAIGRQVIFRLGWWSTLLPTGFHVSGSTLDTDRFIMLSRTRLSLSLALLSRSILLTLFTHNSVHNPKSPKTLGLASFPFARHYLGNRFYFLFLRLLRCFSSPGSLHIAMYSLYSDGLLQPPGFPIRKSAGQS